MKSFINIMGLSISLMFVIIIAHYTTRCLTIDSDVEKKDRIFALATDEFIGSGYTNARLLKARYPQIEQVCAILSEKLPISISDNKINANILFVDSCFFNLFSIKLNGADNNTAIIPMQNVVISQSFANKIFGTFNPIGQNIKISLNGNFENFTVCAIMPDMDKSIIKQFDMVVRFENIGKHNSWVTDERMSNVGKTILFMLQKKGTNLQEQTGDILAYFQTYFWPYIGKKFKEVNLIPLKDIYFSNYRADCLNFGDWSFVMILISIGILILLFAVVNYINLTVAQTSFRAKEMAIRRLLGSNRTAIFTRLILEGLIITTVSFIIGINLAAMVEPWANDLLKSNISIFKNPGWVFEVGYFVLIILISVIAGIIPATIISNYKPIEVVKGSFKLKTSMVYSKILITFQYIITIALIGGSLTMYLQVKHLLNAPMGYNTKDILNITNNLPQHGDANILKEQVMQLPFVEEVAFSQGIPLKGSNNVTISVGKEKMISLEQICGDSAYFRMMGFKLKQDNKFAEKKGIYLNEYAFRELGIKEDVVSIKLGSNYEFINTIDGIYNDFTIRNMLREQTAASLSIISNFEEKNQVGGYYYWAWNILVKITPGYNPAQAYKKIEEIYKTIPNSGEFSAQYIDNQLAETYSSQQRTCTILLIFTFIAILISSLGLLAMSTYYIKQRQMEIAIRKVFGSTHKEILQRLISNFMKLVAIAFILAVPIIWYTMEWWLEDYNYKITLTPLIFVAAGIITTLIAFITVYWQSHKAATINPAETIK